MRTTLTIDDDLMMAAKGLAARDRKTVGEIVSEIMRKGLATTSAHPRYRNGIRLMPARPGAGVVTLELVQKLLDEEDLDRAGLA
jgi:hypothetical protein